MISIFSHLPLSCRDLHCPDEGGGVAGNGHGAGHPPGEDEDRVPEHNSSCIKYGKLLLCCIGGRRGEIRILY